MRSGRERRRLGGSALVLVPGFMACAACDPLVDVAGAFFPGWMVCVLLGIASTALVRQLLLRAQLEPSLGPLLIVYPSLATTIALVLWLGLYRGSP
jgi:YtcA family